MSGTAKYVWTALLIAAATHAAFVHFLPRVMMDAAITRIGAANAWHLGERVTPASRTIVRPSPDFAYSACPFNLDQGPVLIQVTPWDAYWSLSLFAGDSDNFYTLNDREARFGAAVTLVRAGEAHPEGAAMVVESPSSRGIALIRRLAPTRDDFNAAAAIAREDVCASVARLGHTS